MLEIVLTREDANTEYALLAEWLVEDRAEVTCGPAGLRRRDDEGDGRDRGARRGDDRAALRRGRRGRARQDDRLRRRVRRRARVDRRQGEGEAGAEAAPRATARRRGRRSSSPSCTGSTSRPIEKRGFITEKDVEELIARAEGRRGARRRARRSRASRRTASRCRPRSTPTGASGALEPASSSGSCGDPDDVPRARRPPRRSGSLREHGRRGRRGRRARRGLAGRRPAHRDRGRRPARRRARPSCARRSFAIGSCHAVRRRPRAALPPRVPRLGDLGRTLDPVRRRRPPRSVGDARRSAISRSSATRRSSTSAARC